MKKRVFSILLALTMILTFMPAMAFADSDTTTISNLEELKSFRNNVNSGTTSYAGKTIQLSDDINTGDESWTPIGTKEHPFEGSFVGGGKTITYKITDNTANYEGGLFGVVKGTASFENLKINATVSATGSGAIVGGLYSHADATDGAVVTVDEVEVSGTINANKYAAGLIGQHDKTKLTLTNCTNKANVTGGSYGAGILGRASENCMFNLTFSNCKNEGAVSGNMAAGIVANTNMAKADGIKKYDQFYDPDTFTTWTDMILREHRPFVYSGSSNTGTITGTGSNPLKSDLFLDANTPSVNNYWTSDAGIGYGAQTQGILLMYYADSSDNTQTTTFNEDYWKLKDNKYHVLEGVAYNTNTPYVATVGECRATSFADAVSYGWYYDQYTIWMNDKDTVDTHNEGSECRIKNSIDLNGDTINGTIYAVNERPGRGEDSNWNYSFYNGKIKKLMVNDSRPYVYLSDVDISNEIYIMGDLEVDDEDNDNTIKLINAQGSAEVSLYGGIYDEVSGTDTAEIYIRGGKYKKLSLGSNSSAHVRAGLFKENISEMPKVSIPDYCVVGGSEVTEYPYEVKEGLLVIVRENEEGDETVLPFLTVEDAVNALKDGDKLEVNESPINGKAVSIDTSKDVRVYNWSENNILVNRMTLKPGYDIDAKTAADYSDAKESADAVKKAREAALQEINNVKPSDYAGDSTAKAAIEKAITEARTAINSATTTAAITSALTTFRAELAKYKTDAQKLSDAKTTALNEINAVKPADYAGDATAKAAVEKAISTAKTAVNAATTVDAVNTAMTTFRTEMAKYKTDAQKALEKSKSDAVAELDAIKLTSYQEPEKTAVKNAIAEAKTAIDAATTTTAVDTALAAAKETIAKQAKYKSSLPKPKAKAPAKAKKALTAKWKKLSAKNRKKVTGFQVQIATNSTFTKNAKVYTVKGSKKTSKKIKSLKSKKTYYVRVRTYKTTDGVKTVGKWSAVKKIKTK